MAIENDLPMPADEAAMRELERQKTLPRRWADEQQYVAAPMEANRDELGNIVPKVHLLWMTPDPLGANAALARMYEGKPTYSLADITNDERDKYWADVQKTHLQAPLESIKLHFFLEGVTRSFTHQMVRQRTAVYAQESLRFAVKEDLANDVSLPPSIAALPRKHPNRQKWEEAIKNAGDTYNFLVANGVPAEDARGLMPHAVTTRLNYVTDLRNLAGHAGNRLCTQAQFEWRAVFLGVVQAIRDYTPDFSWLPLVSVQEADKQMWESAFRWQQQAIADSALFRPICYQLGRCPFNASFDRACTIRKRVEVREAIGSRDSERWYKPVLGAPYDPSYKDDGIRPEEWLLDPTAARKTGGAGHE